MKTVVTHTSFLCRSRNKPDAIFRKRQRCPRCGGKTEFPFWSPRVNLGTCFWICEKCTNKNKELRAHKREVYLANMKAGKARKAEERLRDKETQDRIAASLQKGGAE